MAQLSCLCDKNDIFKVFQMQKQKLLRSLAGFFQVRLNSMELPRSGTQLYFE